MTTNLRKASVKGHQLALYTADGEASPRTMFGDSYASQCTWKDW